MPPPVDPEDVEKLAPEGLGLALLVGLTLPSRGEGEGAVLDLVPTRAWHAGCAPVRPIVPDARSQSPSIGLAVWTCCAQGWLCPGDHGGHSFRHIRSTTTSSCRADPEPPGEGFCRDIPARSAFGRRPMALAPCLPPSCGIPRHHGCRRLGQPAAQDRRASHRDVSTPLRSARHDGVVRCCQAGKWGHRIRLCRNQCHGGSPLRCAAPLDMTAYGGVAVRLSRDDGSTLVRPAFRNGGSWSHGRA